MIRKTVAERNSQYEKLDEEIENRIRAAIEAATLAMRQAPAQNLTDGENKANEQSEAPEQTLSEGTADQLNEDD